MAKRVTEQDGSPDKGGMRILYVELNGNNVSIQEGLRTLVAAMNRPVKVVPPAPRLLSSNQNAAVPDAQEPESDLFNQEQNQPEDATQDQVEQTEASQNGRTRRKRGEGDKVDRNAGIAIVQDLDFVPDNKQSLMSFFAEKDPINDMEYVLVLGYYLCNTVELDSFGPGHILSAFKHVGKPVPVDLRQTIRNAKKKAWLSFSDINTIRLATEGENVVEHGLPHTGSKSSDGAK